MLDRVSRVNPFVQMKGGPDPSPSQGTFSLPLCIKMQQNLKFM